MWSCLVILSRGGVDKKSLKQFLTPKLFETESDFQRGRDVHAISRTGVNLSNQFRSKIFLNCFKNYRFEDTTGSRIDKIQKKWLTFLRKFLAGFNSSKSNTPKILQTCI
jgi:hypothetical protein